MAVYADEEDVWKCPKHPSRRSHVCGVCPACLRDRLSALCPDCAHPRPCACSPTSATSSSSRFSSDAPPDPTVSALIAGEPAFRRSRSVAAIPFLRSRFAGDKPPALENKSKSSIWSVFRNKKSKREKVDDDYDRKMVMTRSRSIAVETARSSPAKGKGWYFPSPIKAFRQSKSSKVINERSPLYRG